MRRGLVLGAGPLSGQAVFDSDCYMYCLRHRRMVRWLSNPMWWHHTDDYSTCSAMWAATAPRLDGSPLRVLNRRLL